MVGRRAGPARAEAIAEKDTTLAWNVWCWVAETCYIHAAQSQGLLAEELSVEEDAKLRGRGLPAKLKLASLVPRAGPVEMGQGQANLRRQQKLLTRIRHFRALRRGQPADEAPRR